MNYQTRTVLVIAVLILFGSCSIIVEKDGAPERSVDVSRVPDAVPKYEERSKYGNPPSYEVLGKRYYVLDSSKGFVERGIASWYGKKFHGRRTSSGETYDMYAMTAAHKHLPLPTYVEVTNLENNRRVVVKVNDRGPFHANRIIDLSYTAAAKLGIINNGTGLVEVRAIQPGQPQKRTIQVRNVSKDRDRAPAFYIQVGAFSYLANAENLRRKLSSFGEDLVNINRTVIDGEVLHRVRIGPLVTVATADRIVDRLADFGVTDHTIVVDQP